ncbi:MAG: acyl carrier protein [Spirochaetae bacterium HGW-Spirochaetae-8]|jgi:acyl carrier protein|nr:MAG: acyl carrier protein [Spirochaetae bacterium HGW-Spirochaetae-8]
MDSKLVFEKVKNLIAEKLEIDEGRISMDSSFRKDLGADSLDTYELVYAIEEELGVSIPDEKANEFETVRDAVDFLAKLLK